MERQGQTVTSPLPHSEGSEERLHFEIERKFIVTGEWKHLATSKTHIEQGYFETAPGRTVRIRIRDDKAYLTIKGPSNKDGLARYEFETEIPFDDGKKLMELCRPGRIDKTRWLVPDGQHTIEVDEFHGDNDGLVMAEIELGSENEDFVKPTFLGREVTGDRRFYNKHLMSYPYIIWGRQFEAENS
ncbi:MAG: CYTH domain-containing protein [Bacteroidaceae bacterium]|nr:CYTH domain-containing protein [Bacteroidaceae bacterium]